MVYSGRQISFYEIGLNGAGSEVAIYEQLYDSLKNEMRVIEQFLDGLEAEGKTIQDVASLKDKMEEDVKEVIKSAQSVIETVELLDDVDASSRSSRGWEEESTTDQVLGNMSTYITQVEAVLNIVGTMERRSLDGGDPFIEDPFIDWIGTGSDSNTIVDMRRRLNRLRLVDPSANAQIQSFGATEVPVIQLPGVPRRFSYDELKIATADFSQKLGEGGFGRVYRGALQHRIPVAVKRMNAVNTTHGQGMKEFVREVSIISQLRHQNLIELRGWCEDPARNEYMLIYEFMSKGSLDKLLFDRVERTTCLSWPQRFKILTGIADAVAYLHQGSKQQVIHGDIKCANILLDNDLKPKLTDFGLSRLVDHQGEAYTLHFAGSRGYMAPELIMDGKFTEKSDVFAFGVVVLEVVCGQRNWSRHRPELTLVQWVGEHLCKGDLLSTVDNELRGSNSHQMKTALAIGSACCGFDHRTRPDMRVVVEMLAGRRQDELKKIWMVREENGEHDVYERDMTPTLTFDEQWNASAPGCLYYEASPGNLVAEALESLSDVVEMGCSARE